MRSDNPARAVARRRCRLIGWLCFGTTLLWLLAGFAYSSSAQSVATDGKRIALVIGIGKYRYAPSLQNPVNDGHRIAEALRRLNFQVDEAYDSDYRTLTQTLRAFGNRAQDADAALIFYAGHGVQVDHENFLIPADAKLEREHDLVYEALSLDLFLGEVSRAKKVGILLLDACRTNPFVERMSRDDDIVKRASNVQKGLARIDRVPRNTVVALSTRADNIAEDGGSGDSPFTRALLAHFQIPGVELSLFFRSVRDTVLKATNNRQEPYVFSSLGAEPFYFYPRPSDRPPTIGAIAKLEVSGAAGPTPLGVPRPTDPDGDPLTVRITGLPQAGQVRIDGKQVAANDVVTLDKFMTATYKPDGATHGSVGSFDFLVDDGRGGNVTGSVPIIVTPSNRPPVVEPERVAQIFAGSLAIVPPTDPDNDPLTVTITAVPNRGFVRNGSIMVKKGDRLRPQDLAALVYFPHPGIVGDVGGVRYLVEDGHGGKAEGHVGINVPALNDTTRLVSDATLWQRLQKEGDLAAIQSFLTLFPDSQYAAEAHRRALALAAAALAGGPADGATQSVSIPPAPPIETVLAASSAPDSPAAIAPPSPVQSQVAPPPPSPQAQPSTAAPEKPLQVAAAGTGLSAALSSNGQGLFKECTDCLVMVPIPEGSFSMGQSGDSTAMPVHRVTIRAFALAQRPVTIDEWKSCVDDHGCQSARLTDDNGVASMHNLSWNDAQQYVVWLARNTGHGYRLPTRAEWKYAARGNTATRYWWGDQVGVGLANCSDCGGQQDKSHPLPVDTFKANPFGLLSVGGGVSQWVADCWLPNYNGAPADGAARDRANCDQHVLRGGSFRNDRNNITVAVRNYYDTSVRYVGNGFRVAVDLQ
jgi:formylglycine-generating enzyme required for sulfatase activity